METKKMLNKYQSRFVKEGVIKSLMLGLIVGFSVLLVTSVIWWLADLKHIWLCAIFFASVTVVTAPIIYFKKFRPTIKQIATRIDALGLDERVLTMTELERETSYIAMRQRDDAVSSLKKINSTSIKIAVSVSLIVVLCITSVFGIGAFTAAALVERDNSEFIEIFDLEYKVRGNGTIVAIFDQEQTAVSEQKDANEEEQTTEFILKQKVSEGQDANPVLAVPDDDWVFMGWSDGYDNPYRLDSKISENFTIYAIFEKAGESDGDINVGDSAGVAIETEVEGEGDPDPDAETDPDADPKGYGVYNPNNQVYDGATYYGGNTYDNAYNDVIDSLRSDNTSSQEADMIEEYFKTIAQ